MLGLQFSNLAYKVAKVNNLEHSEKYFIAGLLHDLGKNVNDIKIVDTSCGVYALESFNKIADLYNKNKDIFLNQNLLYYLNKKKVLFDLLFLKEVHNNYKI